MSSRATARDLVFCKLASALALSLLLFLSSCEKDFIIDGADSGKKMVVNSVFDNLRLLRVYVTESASAGDPVAPVALADARVKVFEDGVFKEELAYVPSDTANTFGSYQSTFTPVQGKRYTLEVVHPVYGRATMEDALPVATPILSYTLEVIDSTPKGSLGFATIRFKDDDTQRNFYRLNLWMTGTFKYYDPDKGDSVTITSQGSGSPRMLSAEPDTIRDYDWLLFSDRTYNGQERELKFYFHSIPTNYLQHFNVYMELHTVSEAHYQYYRTLEQLRKSPGGEPVDLYTNVKNAYGIFAADAIYTVNVTVK